LDGSEGRFKFMGYLGNGVFLSSVKIGLTPPIEENNINADKDHEEEH
jgi:hypothetical protein